MAKFFSRLFLVLVLIALAVTSTLAIVFFIHQNNLNAEIQTKSDAVLALQQDKTKLEAELSDLNELFLEANADCFQAADSVRIIISNPCDNKKLSGKTLVEGMIWGVFENTVEYRLTDDEGVLLDSGFFNVEAELGVPELFSKEIELDLPAVSNTGRLTFFSSSAQDGSRENIVEIEVSW